MRMRTMIRLGLCAALLLATALTPVAAHAQEPLRGVALVIGESDYDVLPDLANPERDAARWTICSGNWGSTSIACSTAMRTNCATRSPTSSRTPRTRM